MDVSSVVEERMAGKSEQTRRIYVYRLSRFQEWLIDSGGDLEHLTRADVQQYVDWLLAHKKSPSTVAVAVSAIRAWARWTGQEHAVAELCLARPHFRLASYVQINREKAQRKILEPHCLTSYTINLNLNIVQSSSGVMTYNKLQFIN